MTCFRPSRLVRILPSPPLRFVDVHMPKPKTDILTNVINKLPVVPYLKLRYLKCQPAHDI